MTAFTYVDALLVLMVAVTTALGAKRKGVGFVVGVGSVLLLRPLLVVAARETWVALAAALVGTLLLALIGQRVVSANRRQGFGPTLLGGIGGASLGLTLLLALVTALPIQRNPADEREVFYPPRTGPADVAVTLNRSPLVRMGRSVLLHPLLPAPTPAETSATRVWRVYGALHQWLVIGEPWNER